MTNQEQNSNLETNVFKSPNSKLGVFLLYSVGQLGWTLTSFGVLNLLTYFYLPPQEGGESIFPPYIFQGAILGTLTLIGIISAGGRFFDAFTDPLIANFSDKSTSDVGRRRKFMLLSFLPFTLLSILVFYPPASIVGPLNLAWLSVSIVLFYFFMTMYVVPYTALIAELGRTAKERMTISTMLSVTWALGFAIGSQTIALQGYFESTGLSSTAAFQRTITITGLIGGVLMGITAFFLNEKKYVIPVSSSLSMKDSIRVVLGNKNFRYFAASDFFYWMAITFITVGIAYYVVELMGKEKEYTSAFQLKMFALAFLCYFPVLKLGNRFGKVIMMRGAFLLFSASFLLTYFLGQGYLPELLHENLILVAAALSVSVFGILPNAIVGDLADAHGRKIGESLAGMYFAVRTLIMKAGIAIANLVFSSFIIMNNNAGIRLSALVAFFVCILGYLFFLKYQSPESISEDHVALKK